MIKRILSLFTAAVLMLAVLVPAALAEEISPDNVYYVYTENGKPLNVRDNPNGEIVGTLPFGTKVQVTSVNNDEWAVITFQYDKEGYGIGEWPAYVNVRFLIKVDPEELIRLLEEETQNYTGDPVADINAEFASAVDVEDYRITARPARVTSWVNMRWVPSETGMIIAQYRTTEALIVLKELEHYLQVQDPDTGDVGYIHKKFAAR